MTRGLSRRQALELLGLAPFLDHAALHRATPPADHGCADVREFGAAGDGRTDDTAAFQAAADKALALNIPLYVSPPSVAYRLASTVSVRGDRRVWIQHQGAEIRDANPTGPCVKFAGVRGQMTGLWVRGLRVTNDFDRHRVPAVQFGDEHGLSGFYVEGLSYDGQRRKGDATTWQNVFDGAVRDAICLDVQGGVGVVLHTSAVNGGNIEFANVTIEEAPCGFVINDAGEGAAGAQNLLNSLHFNNCKIVRDAPGLVNKYLRGRVAEGAPRGATALTLDDADHHIGRGDWIALSSRKSRNLWLAKVADATGAVLTLGERDGLPFSISRGDFLVSSNFGVVCGAGSSNFVFTIPHFEGVIGIVGHDAVGFDVNQPELGVGCLRVGVLMRSCQDWIIRRPYGATGDGAGCVVLEQLDDPNNGRNSVRGVSALSAMTRPRPLPLKWEGGVQASVTERFGGTPASFGFWHQDGTVPASQDEKLLIGPMGAARAIRITDVGGVTFTRLVVNMAEKRKQGSLRVTLFLNGRATDLSVVIDERHPAYHTSESFYASDDTGVFVSAGNTVDLRVTTSAGWAPSANSVDVQLWGEC